MHRPRLPRLAAERAPLVRVDLLAEKAAARPGDTVTIALRQVIKPGWHTYWSNPGDSGEPTRIDWKLPAGASATPISWPLPTAIPVGPLMNYGYSGEILLLSDITLPKDVSGNSVDIAADVKWLVCEEICVPEEASVRLALPLIEGPLSPRPSPHAGAIAAARKNVPGPAPWRASFQTAKDGVVLKVDGVCGGALLRERNTIFSVGVGPHQSRRAAECRVQGRRSVDAFRVRRSHRCVDRAA